MKWTILIASICFLASSKSFAQDTNKNAVFLELLGNGYYYSLNYEREFGRQFVFRIGGSLTKYTFIMPVTLGRFFGSGKHHFELAAGFDFANYDNDDGRENGLGLTGFIGYRFQKPDGKFLFRIGATPLYIFDEDSLINFLPTGGVSFGYRF
jgi:hypothetical protein